jgi:hypothetical protein
VAFADRNKAFWWRPTERNGSVLTKLEDHEGPDPDCRRCRPTVPMTRVNPVDKSSSPFHGLVCLLPLSCRIG